jgi:hypothetical protein
LRRRFDVQKTVDVSDTKSVNSCELTEFWIIFIAKGLIATKAITSYAIEEFDHGSD